MMDLAKPYFPPRRAKQVVGSDVFPEVLATALVPKAAPYSRANVPLPIAPPYPKLVEHPAIRPPVERKRTISGNAGGEPKKATLPPRPPLLTPSGGPPSAAEIAQNARKMNTGVWAPNAVAEPKQRPAVPAAQNSAQWNQSTWGNYGWGNSGSSSSQGPPPPPPPLPSGPPADPSSTFSA